MKTLLDFQIKNKNVLIRCDFNVSIKKGIIRETFKIDKAIPTIEHLLQKGAAKIIIITHLGKPKGRVVEELRVNKIQEYLTKKLDKKIDKVEIDKNFVKKIQNTKSQIVLLENIRFYKDEIENSPSFAAKLAQTSDLFINEAFAVCHRKQSSVTGIPKFIDSCAGFLLEKEVKIIDRFLKKAEKPIVSIVGGAKVKTKAPLINALLEISDFVIVSGLIKNEAIVNNIIFDNEAKIIAPKKNLLDKDIDKETIERFQKKIGIAKTIFWNGPFGLIEEEQYCKGTYAIAEAIIQSNALSIIGGGETIFFLNKIKLSSKFSHISTGGGALLEYIINKTLPGIEALKN
jgi:phosphoglycerate kinase